MAVDDLHSRKKPRHSYPSDANTATRIDVLQQVSSARARLSHVTGDYFAACQVLASICAQPQPDEQHSRELVLSTIDTELSILKEEEERIEKAHRVLVDARNRTRMIAPIYSLPPEVLTRIFLEAVCHHAHDESRRPTCLPSNPITFSAVCRLWRDIAIDSRSLWAHLDILIGGTNHQPHYPSSQLWISRLQGTPLRVHIRLYSPTLRQLPGNPGYSRHLNNIRGSDDSDSSQDSSDSDDSDGSSISDRMQDSVARTSHSLSNLISFLTPLISHIDSLDIISSPHCQHLLHSLMNRLFDRGDEPTRMKAVRIIHDKKRNPLRFRIPLPPTQHYSKDPKAFFSSLLTLDLRNVYPCWDHLTLTNLVELRFEAPRLEEKFSVTQAELAATLASCPKLRSLMLFSLQVTPAPVGTRPRPVVLNDLRVLSLRCMAWDGELERVISILHPGQHPLHMSIHLPEEHEPNPSFLAELRSFFCRSNVTIFHANAFALDTWFASQLGPLPNVHTLVLKVCHISDVVGPRNNRRVNPCPINPSIILWPQLRNLYLITCGLDKAHLRYLLSLHAIQKLYLHQCFDDADTDTYLWLPPGFLDECRSLLSDLTPNIEVVVNDTYDDTVNWLFVGSQV